MAVIVAGKLTIRSGLRDQFVSRSLEAVVQARSHRACEDFSVSPDPIDPNRVNIFEKWQSKADLVAFRGAGVENDAFSLVESFDVHEYEM